MQVYVDGQKRRQLKAGDNFGALALLYKCPRSATIKSLSDCELWGIGLSTFRTAV